MNENKLKIISMLYYVFNMRDTECRWNNKRDIQVVIYCYNGLSSTV